MKSLLLMLLCWLPLAGRAQSPVVPTNLAFAGLQLHLSTGGRAVLQQRVDALRRHNTSFQARVALADAYFPLIDRVLSEKGVPLDFHFLVIQESGLQGDAQSIHDAVGYWQFKRESGQDYGLVMNDAVDERKHIVAATRAATQYLLRSNQQYRNWLNALLSFNLGATGARPYTLPTDAGATTMEITEQTHPYVLTFLAHKLAYEPACGLNPRPALQLREFPAPAGQSLPALAADLHASPEELARHNRWLLAGTVPSDKAYTLVVPVTDDLQLTALSARQPQAATTLLHPPTPDPENVDFVRVNDLRALVALPGDTKESLAKRAGLKLRRFMHYNELYPFDNVVAGQPYFTQNKRDKADVEYHVAQPGESVALVSQKYGVRTKAIWAKNHMARNEELKPGRLLWMQYTRPREVAVEYLPISNPAALAAFERPHGAAPVSAAAEIRETEPYTGRTAAEQRTLQDDDQAAEEADSTQQRGLSRLLKKVVRPAGATAPAEAAAAPVASPAPAAAPAPVAVPAPVTVPAPAVATRPTPARPAAELPSAPVADEPPLTPAEPAEARPELTASTTPPVPSRPAPVAAPQPAAAAAPAPTPDPVAAPASVSVAVASSVPAPSASPAPAIVPAPAPATPAAPAPVAATAPLEPLPANGLHLVQPKETLYGIARRYSLRPADLVAWNELPASPSLRIGQTLRLTAPMATAAPAPAVAATPAVAEVRHTVQAKESLYGIARQYGVSIPELLEWNHKPDSSLRIGEVLLIHPVK